MAVSLLAHEVSDLCLGKPPLRPYFTTTATVSDALSFFKGQTSPTATAGANPNTDCLSIWSCCNNPCEDHSKCYCVGKVCMVDVICFLSREDKLKNLSSAAQEPVSVLLKEQSLVGLVRHLDSHASLFEAIDLMLEGAQNIVIPIRGLSSRKKQGSKSSLGSNPEYCWLTQEDVVRYLLNSIGLFSPLSNHTIQSLGLIDTQSVLALTYEDPASSALPLITKAHAKQISVAVIEKEGKLIGEIPPLALNYCDESVAAAIATLSVGDLMAYINYGGDPPEDLVQLVKERVEERHLEGMLGLIEDDFTISSASYTSSSDEEYGTGKGRGSLGRSSVRAGRNVEVTVCYPWSSLVAVMIQALSHRMSCVWVVEEDGTLVGVVTFAGMLKVFRERLVSMA